MIKPFEYVILKQSNNLLYSMGMNYLGHVIEVFVCGIFDLVNKFKYSMDIPFVIKNSICNSNVICSGSLDNIRFWDIRSNKSQLYVINGNDKDYQIICLKFVSLKKEVNNKQKLNDVNLYYGSVRDLICVGG
ncbi:hypothetical protein RFI_01448 [Reticulomyxa filosa]|uniref:Uncharacterized protein n=1 Tax=Reticulomyxa filosa TaxID=46433 RepID=X6PBQ5_RETFI|nr:hypothetical protein RFI_01448 [Reticulomyxa filosa]|eukprot:ETO35616.1 hypothetical protein RFI_01448 [Reticulomyxa filosa]